MLSNLLAASSGGYFDPGRDIPQHDLDDGVFHLRCPLGGAVRGLA